MASELAVYDQGLSVKLYADPEDVLAEAKRAADVLVRVIKQKDKPVMFNGEQYIEREDWGMVAKFYGCTAKTVETRYVEFGEVKGWEATAVCLDSKQNEIGRAESMCLNDEENWGMVTEYEWVDKIGEDGKKIWDPKGGKNKKGSYVRERIKVGEKPKPLFQLRSMAQTRAEAKALKSIFGYVVVLAGYRPSVAEEMTGNEQPRNDADPQDTTATADGKKAAVTSPQRASEVVQEEITGSITGARLSSQGSLWFHLGEKMIVIAEAKVTDDMVNGSLITVKAKKMKNEAMGEFWGVTEVVKCEPVVEGDTTEDESQESESAEDVDPSSAPSATAEGQQTKAAETVEQAPMDERKQAVAKSLKDVFEGGGVKTAREIADEVAVKKDKAWRAHVGHDPAKHINYKQGMLLFTICGKNGLNISDEIVKELLTDIFPCQGHRYLITKEQFPKVLDVLDPEFKFHEKK